MDHYEIYTWTAMLCFPVAHLLQLKNYITVTQSERTSYLIFSSLIIVNILSFLSNRETTKVGNWISFIIPSILELLIILIIIEKDDPKQNTGLFTISFFIILLSSIYYLLNINIYIKHAVGLIPAFLFPMGVVFTYLKLYTTKRHKQATGIVSWSIIFFLMFSVYLLSNHHNNFIDTILFLLPAILSIMLIAKLYHIKKKTFVFKSR